MRSQRVKGSDWSRRARCLLLLTMATLVLGCASAAKRYEQGSELEAQGRLEEAARRYIDALRKDPGLIEARQRLESIGPRVIDDQLERARAFGEMQDYVRAADLYRTIDVFVRDAGDVGIPLVRPEGYAEERRVAFDGAIDQRMSQGARAERLENWSNALEAYRQVQLYAPDRRQEEEALDAQIRTLTGWGRADLQAARYRAALQHADQILELTGGLDSPATQAALALRQGALELGTVHVVIAPFGRSNPVRRDLDRDLSNQFLQALNDELELTYWSSPPLFVAIAAQLEVRRELRHQDALHSILTVREASRLGRALDAHLVVSGGIVDFETSEREVREEIMAARTKSGEKATYRVHKGKRDYLLRIAYSLVDAERGRKLQDRKIEVQETVRFQAAHYNGDIRDLELTRDERGMFDSDRRHDERSEVEERLIEKASEKISDQVFQDLLSRVP